MFLDEVAKKCLEVINQEKEAGRPVPEPRRRPTTLPIKPQYNIPTEENEGDTPHTSTTSSGSTYTMTVSSNPGETTTTITTANTADGSTPHPEWKNYNTSGKTTRRSIEQGLPNQAITLFVPIGMAEDLTKVQLLILCNEIKTEIQEVKNIITSFPFEEMQRNFSEITTMLDERMTNLEEQYSELKNLVKQGTTQSYIANPALLEHWNPADMVIKHSPWRTMRLVLNKVASENITDLFPSDWHPRPIMSTEHEKQYKVMIELMTHKFQQCGNLPEENIIEMDNYQDFLSALQHHVYMGNVSTTQLIHFIIFMVYMSFCRLSHYTEYMTDRDAVLLKAAVHISLVIMAFKTTFSMRGGHHTVNPYFKNIPTVVRRNLHIVNTRYIEQQCTCKNHVQCDIYPIPLTTEVVLPSYQHFLQSLNLTGTISRETNVLSMYGKTIQMMILARVNGYYSPFIPSIIMQEEDKAETGDVFSLAEEDFFRHRLRTLYPKIDEEGIKTAIGFLATQKLVNCPCTIHTEERGYEWIVFRREPDRKIGSSEDEDGEDVNPIDISDDDVFFSAEAEEALLTPDSDEQETTPESERSLEKKNYSSTDLSDGYKEMAKPQISNLLCDSSLHSRDKTTTKPQQTDQKKKEKNKKKKNKEREPVETEETPMVLDDENYKNSDGTSKKRKGFSYYPFLTYKRDTNKTFYYKYFRPYSHDYRRLRMEEKCQCPKAEPHSNKCEWYEPNIIYILDTQGDISASEEAAQQKIYHMYLNSLQNPPEYCGCRTAAEIAYMGHNTGCNEFQYIHERESYEVLLAILKKRKKVTFPGCPFSKNKRPRLQSPKLDAETRDDSEEIPVVQKTPRAKEVPTNLSQESPDSFPLIADTAESASNAALPNTQPENPPSNPPKPLPDLIAKSEDGVDCPNGETNGGLNGETNGEANGEPDGEVDEEMPLWWMKLKSEI